MIRVPQFRGSFCEGETWECRGYRRRASAGAPPRFFFLLLLVVENQILVRDFDNFPDSRRLRVLFWCFRMPTLYLASRPCTFARAPGECFTRRLKRNLL